MLDEIREVASSEAHSRKFVENDEKSVQKQDKLEQVRLKIHKG